MTQFEKMGDIESVKAVSNLFCPVSGEVVEVNQPTADKPELVNEESYGKDWLIKVKLSDPDDLDKLLSPKAYREFVAAEVKEEANT